MNLEPLSREMLDYAASLEPSPLQFRPKCHPHAITPPSFVSYHDGILTISCVICRAPIVQIRVASEPKNC